MFKNKQQILRRPRLPIEGHFCNYSHRVCLQNRLDGYDYCMKHILEDKNSPYKQCNYVSNKTGKRCPSAAPKADKKDGYCQDHARKTQLLRQKAMRKKKPTETPETLLEELEHYGTKINDPHLEIHGQRRRGSNDSLANRVLEYASSSDSESEFTLVDQAWRGDGDSDAESVDSEQEDPLKHAGIYTAEEVALITRDKLIRLQSLYIDQFKRLQHVMREKRRKYLHGNKLERETLGGIRAAKEDPEQREEYERLVAMKRYHKRYGKEALLHRQSKERRIAVAERENYKPPAYPRCIHVSGPEKCGERTVPLSKYCMHHILQDPLQVLFRRCQYGGGICKRPVFSTVAQTYTCIYHTQLEEHKHRFPPKQKTESQDEDTKEHIDVVSTDTEPRDMEGILSGTSSSSTPKPESNSSHMSVSSQSSNPNEAGTSLLEAGTSLLEAGTSLLEAGTRLGEPMDTSTQERTDPV